MNMTLLQIAPDEGMGLIGFIVSLAIAIGLFFALRGLMLWYWRVDELIGNQRKQIQQMQTLIDGITDLYRLQQHNSPTQSKKDQSN